MKCWMITYSLKVVFYLIGINLRFMPHLLDKAHAHKRVLIVSVYLSEDSEAVFLKLLERDTFLR